MTKKSPEQKQSAPAKVVVPPNQLKEKAGEGGFDAAVLARAQERIENNTIDFQPVATQLIGMLEKAVSNVQSGALAEDAAMRAILHPVMQLRAQGAMFHYPLVTDISDILVNFLETVKGLDKDVMDIVVAHKTSLGAVLSGQVREAGGKTGKAFCTALTDSCERYYKTRMPR